MVTFLLIFALGGYLMFRGRGCGPPKAGIRPIEARIVTVGIGKWQVKAEVADTPELRQKGLSGRTDLEPGYGMLFVYEEPATRHFWMKDTVLPLSIAFIKEDGTIVQIEKMQPQDLTQVSSEEPVNYALEVRQGWFEERRLGPGIKAQLPEEIPPLPPPPPAPGEPEPEAAPSETEAPPTE